METPHIGSNDPYLIPPSGGGGAVGLIECPRDAMQGWKNFIPTKQKIKYLNQLLKVGFHTLDCGSFVSPKAIPQMADTAEVLSYIDFENTNTKLLVIIVNQRGAEDAVKFKQVQYFGYPFSISPTFQKRNANSSIEESFERVKQIQEICKDHGKELVVYLSMAFGNPYGDDYNEELVLKWAEQISSLDVSIISLADTVGLANAQQVERLSRKVIETFPSITIGLHLHSTKENWKEKLDAALQAGCRRIDGALEGIGGCPMANDELVGNMDTSLMIPYLQQKNMLTNINNKALQKAMAIAAEIFV